MKTNSSAGADLLWKIADYEIGMFTIGCGSIGFGIGLISGHWFAGVLIGGGCGYILDKLRAVKLDDEEQSPERPPASSPPPTAISSQATKKTSKKTRKKVSKKKTTKSAK